MTKTIRPLIALTLALGACQPAPPPAPAAPPPAPTVAAPPPPPPEPPRPAALAYPSLEAPKCANFWRLLEPGAKPAELLAEAGPGATWCDPTHARLTLAILRSSGVPEELLQQQAPEVLAGVLWNDDPERALLDGKGAASPAPKWPQAFAAAQQAALGGKVFGPGDPLLARVHFGDLQRVHALTVDPKASTDVSRDAIFDWLEFTYRVALGELTATTKLSEVKVHGIAALFAKRGPATVGALFGAGEGGDVRLRALGSALHVIEDAAGSGHVQRDRQLGTAGGIAAFGSATKGRHLAHAGDEGWRDLWNPEKGFAEDYFAREALQQGTDFVRLLFARRDWEAARALLASQAFSTDVTQFVPKRQYFDVRGKPMPPPAGEVPER